MLHLPGKIFKLSFHRQQEVWEGLQELFWVRATAEHAGFGQRLLSPCHLIIIEINCNYLADWVKHDLEKSAMPVCSWWNDGRSYPWEPRRTGTMWVCHSTDIMAELLLCYDRTHALCKLMSSPLFLAGCWCQRRSQPKDNFQAQEDKVHLQESTAESDQQAAERA